MPAEGGGSGADVPDFTGQPDSRVPVSLREKVKRGLEGTYGMVESHPWFTGCGLDVGRVTENVRECLACETGGPGSRPPLRGSPEGPERGSRGH